PIDRQRVPPHEIVGVTLRQAAAQNVEALAAIPGARNDNRGVHQNAPLVLYRRHEPRRIGIARMRRDGKAEFRWPDRRDLMPVMAAILGAKDTVMVLAPHDLRIGGAAREAVNVLRDRQPLLL